jgi:hypothetical protein
MRWTMALSSSIRPILSRKGMDSGKALRTTGISSTGTAAARNTDCQP